MTDITIDLRDKLFTPGSKRYERIKWSFTNTLTDLIDFYLLDLESKEDGNLLGSWIVFMMTGESLECELEWKVGKEILTPSLHDTEFAKLLSTEEELLEVIEWTGMVECDAERYYKQNEQLKRTGYSLTIMLIPSFPCMPRQQARNQRH